MIKSKKDGLQTPYRRLIFSISTSDILQSLSAFLGPFLNVSNTVPWAYLAVGNKHTCRLDGFLFAIGSGAAPMYSCCLSIYYYCKLYKKMSNEAFAYKIERWLHIIIISFLLISNIFALVANTFNGSVTGAYCTYAVLPTGCRQRPDIFGECNASPDPNTVTILTLLNSVIVPAISMIVAVLLLSVLLWKIVAQEKIFSNTTTSSGNGNIVLSRQSNNEEISNLHRNLSEELEQEEPLEVQVLSKDTEEVKKSFLCIETPGEAAVTASTSLRRQNTTQTEVSDRDKTSSLARAYRQEMMAQLLLYSSSLLLVYLIYMSALAIVLVGKTPHPTHFSFAQFLFPLQGLFNIIIYLRPAARITRIRRQGTSWIKAYYLIIKNGGEALKEHRPLAEMVAVKPPTSVKFGVENPEPHPKQLGESFRDVSNECMYVDSSIQLSRGNAAFNSSQDWHYVVGSEGESSQEPQDVIACIHHNDLDMVVEESVENSQQLVSSESKVEDSNY